MVEIQFELDQIKTTINGKLEEPFQNIIDRYINKNITKTRFIIFCIKR